MAYLSPGVYVTETDLSTIVPNEVNNVAFFGGQFNKGPLGEPYVVTNKEELVQTFGEPTDDNYNDFFQCYKFFDYANQLVITRGYEECEVREDTPPRTFDGEYREGPDIWNLVDNGDGTYSGYIRIPQNQVKVPNIQIGDWVRLITDVISVDDRLFVQDMVYHNFYTGVDPIAHIYVTFSNAPVVSNNNDTNSNNELDLEIEYQDFIAKVKDEKDSETLVTLPPMPSTWTKDAKVRIYSFSHKNGLTGAIMRGEVANWKYGPYPIHENANNSFLNYDSVWEFKQDGVFVPSIWFNNNRLRTMYDLIKSQSHWEEMYHLPNNPLKTWKCCEVLKFWSKSPDDDEIQIAIAHWYDFLNIEEDNGQLVNHAIAFQDVHGGSVQTYYLKDLFQYPPQKDELAIAIKRGTEVETFIVSFNPDGVDGNNRPTFIETVINKESKFVYVLSRLSNIDPYSPYLPASYLVQDRFGTDDQGVPLGDGKSTRPLRCRGGKSFRLSEGAIREAYESVLDKEKYEIDIVIGNEFYENPADPVNSRNNLNIAIELADARKDCIAFVGARYVDTVGKKANDATNNLVKFITAPDSNTTKLTRSMFGAFFGNYHYIYDRFNRKYRWINCAGDMAGIRCSVSSANDSWWASAGMKRGIVRGVDKIAFSPNLAQRDTLYKNGINPIVVFPGTGILVWGNKTLLPYASSFDRINVRGLFNTLERAMAKAARSQVFEFNDVYTRNSIVAMFNPYLSSVQAARGIVDYKVVCDESNNTPDVISRNELVVDIFIKPNYVAEYIQLNFVNVGTRSIASVIGG